jgi:hypothetical protein
MLPLQGFQGNRKQTAYSSFQELSADVVRCNSLKTDSSNADDNADGKLQSHRRGQFGACCATGYPEGYGALTVRMGV